MARRVLTIGIPALAAYTFYTTSRLLSEYPIERRLASYHQLHSVIPVLAKAKGKEFGDIDVVYARVPLSTRARSDVASPPPPASSASASASPPPDHAAPPPISYRPKPLDQLLSAFWSTWTLHVEHHLAALFLGSSIPHDMLGPEARSSAADGQEAVAFAGAIFPIWRYYADSVVFQWRFSPAMGGVQELAAVIKEQPGDQAAEKKQVMEISYACAQYGFGDGSNPLGVLDRVGMAFHKMYMRFLVDQAKRKLEKEIFRSCSL